MVLSFCIAITTFEDSLIEDAEAFSVTIANLDPSVDTGADAQVTLGDSNTRDVLVSFDQSTYGGSEGSSVAVCVLLRSSNVTDITREVILRISTESMRAQGNYYCQWKLEVGVHGRL